MTINQFATWNQDNDVVQTLTVSSILYFYTFV